MYSRRQRSTRNAAVATNANANTNARTTRGRHNKAKNPRRGAGNPDTARVRASVEAPPVVPWIKVMRPPALHLRRTFLVEKWVRPSDLTAAEREVYDAEQKVKEEERQRRLRLQQEKRDQEAKEKEENDRLEQDRLEQERKEKMESQPSTVEAKNEEGDATAIESKEGKFDSDSPTATKTTMPESNGGVAEVPIKAEQNGMDIDRDLSVHESRQSHQPAQSSEAHKIPSSLEQSKVQLTTNDGKESPTLTVPVVKPPSAMTNPQSSLEQSQAPLAKNEDKGSPVLPVAVTAPTSTMPKIPGSSEQNGKESSVLPMPVTSPIAEKTEPGLAQQHDKEPLTLPVSSTAPTSAMPKTLESSQQSQVPSTTNNGNVSTGMPTSEIKDEKQALPLSKKIESEVTPNQSVMPTPTDSTSQQEEQQRLQQPQTQHQQLVDMDVNSHSTEPPSKKPRTE